MKLQKLTLSSGAFLAFALTTGALSAQETSPVDGTWQWTSEGWGGQEVTSSLTLKHEEDALTGTYQGAFGPEATIEEASLSEDKISFKVTRTTFGDRTMTTTFDGSLEGDKIEGTIETTGGDQVREEDWEAYRVPEVDPTGLWKWSTPSRREGGEDQDAWVKLDYTQGKLGGVYKSEQGQAEIKDAELDGKKISFKVERGMGDRVFTTAYEGTLSDGKIEGTIESTRGDNTRSQDWVASRDHSKVDPVGEWTWETPGRGGDTSENVLMLKKEEDALTGTYTVNDDEMTIEDVKLDGDQIHFVVNRETERGDFTSNFKGRVDGDQIVGNVTSGGGEWTFRSNWKAEREVADAKPEGEWTWSTRWGRGGEGRSSTLALSKTDGTLGGTLTTGDNEAEIKDAKLEGNTLTFKVDREFRDSTMTMNYRGEIRGDSIDGTWQMEGDDSGWARNWEASRSTD